MDLTEQAQAKTYRTVPQEDMDDGQIIWDYLKLGGTIEKSDLILALGCNDIRVADRASDLYLQGYGDVLMFSGKNGKRSISVWSKPEAEVFRDRALEKGVPSEKILIENKSTNTGENVQFSFKILEEKGIKPKGIILVQKPYMERRTLATFMKQWPDDTSRIKIYVTSPEVTFLEYPTKDTGDFQRVLTIIIGDLQRIQLYAQIGFQIPQDIPNEVLDAFKRLKNTGRYNSHLVQP
ncbi:hypothetical protein CHS0354_012485 [Potamilus streckersoni]|uniref:DUF218 domain-containing protein n=1 Tax=Potamilus streckersoni TaxID=2493646 RepID=A0AAE0S0B8_9BIVA|nr:hypothetical protein CHS0354_012485 [Potamilus streckersoni]